MIIIKSQDKTRITEIKKIEYFKNPKSGECEFAANYKTRSDGMGGLDDDYDVLGFYESEERAKEVMEMIENHIKYLEHIKIVKTFQYFKGIIPDPKDGLIFTMPKK